jgi:hypothetical protein
VISSAFSAADFRLFGAHPQQFYLYLIHDPTSGEDASLASLRGLTQRGRVSRDERLQLYIGAWPLFDGRPAVGPSGIPRPLVGLSVRPSTASFFVVLSPSFVEALPAAARAAIPGERALAIPSALTDRYSLSFAIEGQDPLLFEARAEAVRRTLMSRNRYTGKLTPATDYAGVAFVASQATFTEQLPTGADSLSAKRTYSPDLMTALGYLGYDFVRQELGLTVTLKKDDVTIYQEVFDNAQLPGVLLNLGHHHFNDHIQKRECY